MADDRYEGYPPYWHVLERLGPSLYAVFGFNRDIAFANRFAARYRFATSVTDLILKDYGADTRAGYSALARLAFAYSAFESMLELIGVGRKDAASILGPYPVAKWLKELRRYDPQYGFFQFVRERLGPKHEAQNVGQFLKGQGCDISALAASIRHVFFHGELTPNAGGSNPQVVRQICECLFKVLVEVMDQEFGGRLVRFERKAAPKPARPSDGGDDDIPF
jgi:hypothetical protein